MKIQNLVPESVKSATNVSGRLLPAVNVNKIVYVAQRDEFVTKMIVNVVMLTRLDKNVSNIPFFDVNVSNFLLDENVNIFLLDLNIRLFLLN